jgi:hypothetical protein
MNCRDAEPLIALYVEGDGAEPEHLAVCPLCRQFAGELRASQAALKDLREEAIDPALLDAVRARVLSRIAAPRRAPWWWLAAPAAACALVLLAVTLGPVPDIAPPPRAAVRIPAAPEAPQIVWAKPRPRAEYASVPKQALLIKILTDDPNVVIYCIVDSPKEGE